jgi:carbon-monoxide dehydrogenase large subunit
MDPATPSLRRRVAFKVNGAAIEAEVPVRKTLADFLRQDVGLTGTHLGCEHGVCGACTLLVDGASARSCLMLAVQADGSSITTVEGLAVGDPIFRALEQSFASHHAVQCGFCTAGILTTLVEFLREQPRPSEEDVRIALAGNLCRCTGYDPIVAATLAAAAALQSGGRDVPAPPAMAGHDAGAVVGRDTPRLEDEALIRGKGRFADDLVFPGMLHAAFVRSPHAHAAIIGIDVEPALALAGVQAVVTLADIAPHLSATEIRVALPSPAYRQQLDRPVLAAQEVVHVGEAVAMVLATDRAIAEDGAALVNVDYDILPAVADAVAGLDAGSEVAHSNAPSNLAAEFQIAFGDTDTAFAQAARVVSETLDVHRGGSHSMEGRGTIAVHDPVEDKLTVWSSTQTPHAAKRLLCDHLRLEERQVRVVTPDIGGGFGPKLVFYPEELCVAFAARRFGRPVKWIEDRREHFIATTQERDQRWQVELAMDGEGHILGVRGDMIHDHGAWTARGVNVPQGALSAMTLAYRVPAYHMSARVAVTNKVAVTPVRGAGQPQGVFAMERLLDRAARDLGIGRDEIRRRNLVPREAMPYRVPIRTRGNIEVVLDSGDYPRCQQMALEAAGWDGFPERQGIALAEGRYIGIGLANYVESTGRGPYEPVSVRIEPSGRIFVASGAVAMGQSTATMLAQIVAEQLGGDVHNVRVVTGDTDASSLGIGGFNSRQAVMAGSSAHVAAGKVRDKVLAVAASMLEAEPQALIIEGGVVRLPSPSNRQVTLGEVARAAIGQPGFVLPSRDGPGLSASEAVVIDPMAYANGTAVVEVEVDIATGAVAVRKVVFAHDCGRPINPRIVEGQLMGGIAHGIGNALFEHMRFDENAQPVTTDFATYLLVTAPEMPPVKIVHMESPSPLNPLGIKGVGEAGVIPIAAAVASAVEDALSPFGITISKVPLSPVDVLGLINAAQNRVPPTDI